MSQSLQAELCWFNEAFRPDVVVEVGDYGKIEAIRPRAHSSKPDVYLKDRALIPGMVNAHSHAFQRLLRGRTQARGPQEDSFWTWREQMYAATEGLGASGYYDVARFAFGEMLRSGITTVGEFHYLHHDNKGQPLALESGFCDAVVRAARDVGLRLCFLNVVYLHGGFGQSPSPAQRRFCDLSYDASCQRLEKSLKHIDAYRDERLSMGVAPHSLRAVDRDALVALKLRYAHLPFHIHACEQRIEVEACRAHYGSAPIQLLDDAEVLDALTTVVHGTHLESGDAKRLARRGSQVCFCPSTEADLGDGIGPARELYQAGVSLSLGSDGQTLNSMLEEARRLEMNTRLQSEMRSCLTKNEGEDSARLPFFAATSGGARALALSSGAVLPGHFADLCTIDLSHASLAGWSPKTLLALCVFSAPDTVVCDVMVHGRFVMQDRELPGFQQSQQAFSRVANEIFT